MGLGARLKCHKESLISLLLGIFSLIIFIFITPANAASGINEEINFQGRLLNSQGAVVPDGYYNIEFKIYQDGDGQTAGDTTGSPSGTLKWTEDYLNNDGNGVEVKNGFLSVQLGSITPFGSNVDWNQDTLWLSMNIGGTGTSCTPFSSCSPDGEMLPMKRLTSTPYSINSGCSADFPARNIYNWHKEYRQMHQVQLVSTLTRPVAGISLTCNHQG